MERNWTSDDIIGKEIVTRVLNFNVKTYLKLRQAI